MSNSLFLGGTRCSWFSDAIIDTYVPVWGVARTLVDSRFHVFVFFGGCMSFFSYDICSFVNATGRTFTYPNGTRAI